jgi:putative transcriptional regulator
MIRCNLSRLMGDKKLKISEVSRDTKIHRNTLSAIYKETTQRIELDVIDKLCDYLDCSVGDLFERVND